MVDEKKEFVTNEEGEEIVNPDLVEKKEEESDKTEDDKDADLEKSESDVESEESEEEPEKKEEEEESVPEPKPVEGETPREKALRKEIERLRGLRRGDKEKEIFGKKEVQQEQPKKQPKVDLSQYDKEEVEKFRGIFETIAEDLGFVRKDEVKSYTYEGKANDILNEFLDSHPEYSPENDKDNTLWNQFKEEFALYKKPEDPKLYKKIFQKIHNDIVGVKEVDKGKIAAKQEKIKVASHGGASKQKSASEKEAKIDPSLRPHLKGFSDKDMEEIFGL